jgi:hypothetical protein
MQASPAFRLHPLSLVLVLLIVLHSPALAQVATPPAWCEGGAWHRDCSTAGVKLALEEQQRVQLQAGVVTSYRVSVGSVPSGALYAIWTKPTHGPPLALLTGLTADAAGHLVCADSTAFAGQPVVRSLLGWCGQRTVDDIVMSAPPSFALGEPVSIALLSTDQSVRVYASAIPYPLEASSGGCSVAGEMLNRETFAFSGFGFAPGETLRINSHSGRDAMGQAALADDDGRLGTTIILPAVRGRRGGEATFEVGGGSCSVMLRYGWGDRIHGPGR